MDETDDNEDWRLDRDGWGGGPRGLQASTEALISLTSAALDLDTSSLGLIFILILLIGSKSSESESELELLIISKLFIQMWKFRIQFIIENNRHD